MIKKISVCTVVLLAAVSLCSCVKVVKIGEEGKLTGNVEFNAKDNVSEFWEAARKDIEDRAVDIVEFLKESNGNLKSLVDKYGKYSMGSSGSISYPVKGSGVVEEVNTEKKAGYILVKPDNYDGNEVIKIQVGPIYKGSSTRDTLDIISFGDYTNQEEWAAVSQALNTAIEENVVKPVVNEGLKGKHISFVGTFTADNNDELIITPVDLVTD
ncbi:MAG: DUF2291 domain-containing protein [Lachnospiraceae bacterium oral taxon 082]|nr:DUF2291 domain-containing protein [Lachnospiraceae bacterium oral taxon 082]